MNPLTSLLMLEKILHRIEAENEQEKVWIVGPETGRLLHLLVRVVAPKVILEIGTSVGYSALWMASALAQNGGGALWTIESHAVRFARAQRNIEESGLAEWIHQVKGHAPEVFSQIELPQKIDFAFLDATKMEHGSYVDVLLPRFTDGALLVVDNVLSHHGAMEVFVAKIQNDARFEMVQIPVGAGLLLGVYRG